MSAVTDALRAMGVSATNIPTTAAKATGDKISSFVTGVSGAYTSNPDRYKGAMQALGARINADPGSMFTNSGFLSKLEAAGDAHPELIRNAVNMFKNDPAGATRFIRNWDGNSETAARTLASSATPAPAAQVRGDEGKGKVSGQPTGGSEGRARTGRTGGERPARSEAAAEKATPAPAAAASPPAKQPPQTPQNISLPDKMTTEDYQATIGFLGGKLSGFYPDLVNSGQLQSFATNALKPEVMNDFINKYNADPKLREQLRELLEGANKADGAGGKIKETALNSMRGGIEQILNDPKKMSDAAFLASLRHQAEQAVARENPLAGIFSKVGDFFKGLFAEGGLLGELGQHLKNMFGMFGPLMSSLKENFAVAGNAEGGLITNFASALDKSFTDAGAIRDRQSYAIAPVAVMGKDGKEVAYYRGMDADGRKYTTNAEQDPKSKKYDDEVKIGTPATPAPANTQTAALNADRAVAAGPAAPPLAG